MLDREAITDLDARLKEERKQAGEKVFRGCCATYSFCYTIPFVAVHLKIT